jgi:ribosomal protein S18 acetylase RimI-like enzyme
MSQEVLGYRPDHLDAILALCRATTSFPSFSSDRERAGRALAAPGALALVAVRDGALIGFAHAITDGSFQAYLSMVLVDPDQRRQGVGRMLVAEVLTRSGAARLDLLSSEEAGSLYESFPHQRFPGAAAFRLGLDLRGR